MSPQYRTQVKMLTIRESRLSRKNTKITMKIVPGNRVQAHELLKPQVCGTG